MSKVEAAAMRRPSPTGRQRPQRAAAWRPAYPVWREGPLLVLSCGADTRGTSREARRERPTRHVHTNLTSVTRYNSAQYM